MDDDLKELQDIFKYLFGVDPDKLNFPLDEDKIEEQVDNNDTFQSPIKSSWKLIGHFSPGVATDKRHAKGHDGIDMQAPKGTPIYPIGPGLVIRVGTSPIGGHVITTTHLNGKVKAYYAHCEQTLVAEGQIVTNNTVIATVGDTGNAKGTSAHLHLQVWDNGSLINPKSIFGKPIPLGSFAKLNIQCDLFRKLASSNFTK